MPEDNDAVIDRLIADLNDQPLAADMLVALLSERIIQQNQTQYLGTAMHEIQQRWMQNGTPVVTDELGVTRDVTGEAYFDVIDVEGGSAVVNSDNPRQLQLRIGAGSDCMFDYLTSSCFTSLPGFSEGATFTTLSGCTFKGYSTVQGTIDNIATKANGTEWTVFLCSMFTENITIPAMVSGADHIFFYGKGAGLGSPGISGLQGVNAVASPVITIAQSAPEVTWQNVWIGAASGGTTALVDHGTNCPSHWLNCTFFSTLTACGFDLGGCADVDILGCHFRGANNPGVVGSGADSPDDVLINGCFFDESAGIALANTQSVADLSITGNRFITGGITVNRFSHLVITGNKIQGRGSAAADIILGGASSQDATVSANDIDPSASNTAHPAILLRTGGQLRDVAIVGNNFGFRANSQAFIQSTNADSQFIAVVGNIFGLTGTGYTITTVIGATGTFANSTFGPNAPGMRTQYTVTGSQNQFDSVVVDAGAPTVNAHEGTLYFDSTANTLYINTDGSTTWAIYGTAGGGASAPSPHNLVSVHHDGEQDFTNTLGLSVVQVGDANFQALLSSSNPRFEFDGSGDRWAYDRSNNRWVWVIGNTELARLTATAFQHGNGLDLEVYSGAFTGLTASIDAATGLTILAEILQFSSESALVQGVISKKGSGAEQLLRVEFPDITTEECEFRFLRSTNTTGDVQFAFFQGNNTTGTIFGGGRDASNVIRTWSTGYHRIGSVTVPNNVTAGDLTSTRLIVPNAVLADTDLITQLGGPVGIPSAGVMRFYDTTAAPNERYVGIKAPATAQADNWIITLPDDDPVAGQVLSAATVSSPNVTTAWVDQTGGSGTFDWGKTIAASTGTILI